MNNKFNGVVIILLLNLLISCIYLVIRVIKKDYKKGLMMSGFMILVPIVGLIYLFVSWIIYEIVFKRRKGILSIEELSLSKERIEVIEKGDVQAALNKVPVEEALSISDSKDTRKLLLDILKHDTKGYVSSIYNATDHKDSEVSHYAASAITDIMHKFKEEEKALRATYMKNKKNPEAIDSYWTYLSEFLQTKILPQPEQKRYLGFLEDMITQIEKDMPHKVTGQMYYELVIMFINLNNMEKAKVWSGKAMENKPEDLESYKAGLRFYYDNNDGPQLLQLVKTLMESNIRIDRETLEFIRFYNQ